MLGEHAPLKGYKSLIHIVYISGMCEEKCLFVVVKDLCRCSLLTKGCGGCFRIIDEPSCAKEDYVFETLMFGCSSFKMNGVHSRHGYFSSERV